MLNMNYRTPDGYSGRRLINFNSRSLLSFYRTCIYHKTDEL